MIGAGSVVVADVPPDVVAVGNPCRVLRPLRGPHERHARALRDVGVRTVGQDRRPRRRRGRADRAASPRWPRRPRADARVPIAARAVDRATPLAAICRRPLRFPRRRSSKPTLPSRRARAADRLPVALRPRRRTVPGRAWPDSRRQRAAFRAAVAASPHGFRPPRARSPGDPTSCTATTGRPGPRPRSCVTRAARARRTLMTIHNLAFQGVFDGDLTPLLGLPRDAFGIEGVEFYGRTSFLKAGLMFADAAVDGQPDVCAGDPALAARHGTRRRAGASGATRSTGILNGIDDEAWNPRDRPAARRALRREHRSMRRRATRRAAARARPRRRVRERPLFGVVSRLTAQKGSDLIARARRANRRTAGAARRARDAATRDRASAARRGARAIPARSRRRSASTSGWRIASRRAPTCS